VLSTDTEVDLEYYNLLQPYVSQAYHLEYDEEFSKTEVQSGYFWENEEGGK